MVVRLIRLVPRVCLYYIMQGMEEMRLCHKKYQVGMKNIQDKLGSIKQHNGQKGCNTRYFPLPICWKRTVKVIFHCQVGKEQ